MRNSQMVGGGDDGHAVRNSTVTANFAEKAGAEEVALGGKIYNLDVANCRRAADFAKAPKAYATYIDPVKRTVKKS